MGRKRGGARKRRKAGRSSLAGQTIESLPVEANGGGRVRKEISRHGPSFHSLAAVLLKAVATTLGRSMVGYAYLLTINQKIC